jgi:hypothetical protein
MVPYGHTRDFFYSGHTGTIMSVLLEMWNLNLHCMTGFLSILALYMMMMLVTVRVHYSIDIFGALVFIVYFNQMVSKYLHWADCVFSLPYTVVKMLVDRMCKKNTYGTTSLMEE